MNNIYLVSSGLNIDGGVFSIDVRLEQTINTAKSIREHAVNPKIILLDGGNHSLTFEQREKLRTVYDDIFDYCYHPIIQFVHGQNLGVMFIKSPCEAIMLHETCKILPRDKIYRIFKISGRYFLDDNFDEAKHNILGRYVFKHKEPGVRYYVEDKSAENQVKFLDDHYTNFQLKTRLYSFCSSLLDVATQNYQNVFNTISDAYSNKSFTDIEHSMYRCIDPSLVVELDKIGLSGIQAENGVMLSE